MLLKWRCTGVLIMAIFLSVPLPGQESHLFIPFVKDYPKSVYNAGLQNQDIVQGPGGVMYFANNGGMLVFYGNKWRLYPLPNKTIVRSLAYHEQGRIYAGGQNEFGYFSPDQWGDWQFHSLQNKIPGDHRNFNDVWDTEVSEEGVFFRASGKIFHLANDTCRVFDYEQPVTFLQSVGGEIYMQVNGQGIYIFREGNFERIIPLDPIKSRVVTSMLPSDPGQIVIATLNKGLYRWSDKQLSSWDEAPNAYFSDHQILCADVLTNGMFAFGTAFDGLVIMDESGAIRHHINRQYGLLSNTVQAVMLDHHHHLWIALDAGLNYLLTDSPFLIVRPDNGLEGIPYAARIMDGKLFIGTSNGLYCSDWPADRAWSDHSQFTLIEGSQGQIWSLQVIDRQLFVGHHEGAFVLKGDKLERISKHNRGLWLYQQKEDAPDQIIAGAYNGVHLFKRDQGQWIWDRQIPSFEASSRFVVQDTDHVIWVSHPYRGVYQIKYQTDAGDVHVEEMGVGQGLPSLRRNHVFKIAGEVLFCARAGVYRFDQDSRTFQLHAAYLDFFDPGEKVRRLFESPGGDIWFVTEKAVGVLEVDDKSLHKEIRKVVFPELRGKLIGGYEFIYPADDRYVFFATEDGFILFDSAKITADDTDLSVILDEVRVSGKTDSLLFRGVMQNNAGKTTAPGEARLPALAPHINTILFSFSASEYAFPDLVEYQYMLKGFDEKWSDWTKKAYKEYSNLMPGNYTFRIRARNAGGIVSQESGFEFIIRPPWYATRLAYWSYAIVLFGVLGLIIWLPRRKFKREKDRLHTERERLIDAHHRAIERSEREKIRLQNEKLMIEIEHKNRELVSAALNVIEKKDILHGIAQDLSRLHKTCRDPETKKKIGQILNKFDHEQQFDTDWEQFTYHFEQVHEDFFQQLREKHPKLTSRDHKLCAYLRLNLSTKEIASILNITVRSAEVSRYRLRKKLGLDSNQKLTDYLSTL